MEVRERILDAALGLLAESGAHSLTQPKVARAAGVRQSHLTYYFPTRGELLQEVARHSIEKLAGPLAPDARPRRGRGRGSRPPARRGQVPRAAARPHGAAARRGRAAGGRRFPRRLPWLHRRLRGAAQGGRLHRAERAVRRLAPWLL